MTDNEVEQLAADIYNLNPHQQGFRTEVEKLIRAALSAPSTSEPTPALHRPAELAEALKKFWNTLPEAHRHLSMLTVIDELASLPDPPRTRESDS
jgi:hypothetical protein